MTLREFIRSGEILLLGAYAAPGATPSSKRPSRPRETRFAPILVATLTTIEGLLPLSLSGSGLWSPPGWVTIGGLLVSTGLTLTAPRWRCSACCSRLTTQDAETTLDSRSQ